MKHIRNILTVVFLLLATEYALADNTHIGDITIQQGEKKELCIVLQNAEHEYTSFQMDVKIPEGIAVSSDDEGEPEIHLDANRAQDHTFNVVEVEPGTFRLLAYSMANKTFKGNSGTLVSILIKTDTSDGNYAVNVQNQRFTDKSGNKYLFDDIQATITVQEPQLTITANSYTRYYGEENPIFEYTTEGAILLGTPQISCAATAASPVGDYTIKVQKGSVSNGNVVYVDGILTIKKAPLTIIADNKTKKQGDEMPEFTATYSGLKNEETASVLATAPQFSCEANEASAPGIYDIQVFGAEATNYDISYRKGTLTVTQADAVVVTVKNYSRKYGDSNPSQFEYIVEGGTLTGEPSVSCAADVTSPVGDYDIVIGRGSVSNYNVSFVNGTLTVEKANLSVKADEKEMLIGSTLPEFTATYSGFKNGETSSILMAAPEFQCSANSKSPAGNYTISAFGAEAQNYEISYQSGILTIVDPPLVVSVIDAEREYGERNPTFEYVVEGGNLIGQPTLTCDATISSHAGSYPIVIGKGSVLNANVTYKDGVMTIAKAPLSIKADDKSVIQGEDLPVFTASYNGFKLNEDETSLKKTPVLSCEVASSEQIGEYAIIATGAESDNYDISYTDGVLRVVEPQITVRAVNLTRIYGEANPVFEYVVEGGPLRGEPLVQCSANIRSNVGEYEIIVERGTVSNNSVTFVNGILSVKQAPLTITADNKRMILGEEIPSFTATYSGFKNDNTPTVLVTEPRFSCSATSTSAPGEYRIEVSDAHARNYDITYVSGTLFIEQPPIVVAEVSNSTAGLLYSQLEQSGFSPMRVNKLTVSGLLNGTDIKCIREMIIKGNLTDLDMQQASIVSGGEPYYGEGITEMRTENDVVGQFMFYECRNLISIRLPNTVKLIKFAFDNCDNLLRLDIPESCEEIGYSAISSCASLTSIRIPAATKSFDSYNCLFCPSLTSIEVDPANPWLEAVDGVLFSDDKTELIKYPMGKGESMYKIPDGVKTIASWAFSDAILTQIDLPEGVMEIGAGGFEGCEYLVGIKLPSTLRTIGMSAFSGCDMLTELSLPEGVTEIPYQVASFCKELQRIVLPSTIKTIGGFAFGHCKNLSEIYSCLEDITKVTFSTDYYTGIADAFEEINDLCIWHVVPGTCDKYTSQPWWIESWIIFGDGIENINADNSQLFYSNGKLTIQPSSTGFIRIYTINGTLIQSINAKSGESYQIELPRGMYIINNKKVVLK